MAVGEETTKLSQTITNARKKLENRNANHKLGEENTKMGIITPILAALGWDTEDWNEVSHEYRYRGGNSNPVDYALLLKNTPELFVEAKGYGENIDDVKWAEQCISYASSAGVRWIVLTDGMSWKLYDTARVVPVAEKLFKETKLSDADAPEFFNLLTKASVSKNMLDFIGDTEKVDNAVLEALNGLFGSSKPSQSLVNLVYKTVEEQSRRAGEFDKGKIREALARCEGRFSFPPATMMDLEKMAKTGSANTAVGNRVEEFSKITNKTKMGTENVSEMVVDNPIMTDRKSSKKKAYVGVTIQELIDSQILPVGTRLEPAGTKYSGHYATVVENGILYNGEIYDQPSKVGNTIVKSLDTNANRVNGWIFFIAVDTKNTLAHYRDRYLDKVKTGEIVR